MDCINAKDSVRGLVRIYPVYDNDGLSEWDYAHPGPVCPNTALYDWACILIGNLRNEPDGKSYHIGGMYIEFDNSGSAITTPTINRAESLDYYANLNTSHPTRDYLRVPLISTEGTNTDDSLFTTYNKGTFYAHTSGVTGVHGLAFSDAANSVVYGGALVAFRDINDASQDLIFSRVYFSSGSHVPKAASSQIGLAWEITGQ